MGLDQFPRETWPPIAPVHFSFQLMVAVGTFLALVGALSLVFVLGKTASLNRRGFLNLLMVCGPLGFLALEAGWVVTEVGRQPWIIYGIMRTSDAVSPVPGLTYSMVVITSLYCLLAFVVIWLMVRQFRHVS